MRKKNTATPLWVSAFAKKLKDPELRRAYLTLMRQTTQEQRLALLAEVLEERGRTGEIVKALDADGQPLYRLASTH